MKKITKVLAVALFISCLAFAVVAQTNDASPPGAPAVDPQSATGLLLVIIPVVVPILVWLGKKIVPVLPGWFLPILAPGLGALVDWIASQTTAHHANPALALALGSAGVGIREIIDQVGRKTGLKSAAPLILAFGLSGIMLCGCATFGKQSIEGKAKGIAFVVSSKVLKKHADYREGFIKASSDLKFIAEQEILDVTTVIRVIDRLPKLEDGDTAIYVQGAIIMFSDELSALALKNPEEVRLGAKGLYEGIDLALGFAPVKSLKAP